jgi:hypothetical protein
VPIVDVPGWSCGTVTLLGLAAIAKSFPAWHGETVSATDVECVALAAWSNHQRPWGLLGSAADALGIGPIGTPKWPLWFVIVTWAETLCFAPATNDAAGTETLNG